MNLIKDIRRNRIGKVLKDVYMKNYTTFHVGGKVSYIVYPKNENKLILLIKLLNKNNILYKVVGNGSNLVFSDEPFNGVLIKLDELNKIKISDNIITAGSGNKLIALSMKLSRMGLTGFEFATGIPGTLGGAVYMNAGAWKSDMGFIISDVSVLTPELKIVNMYNKDMNFHYRSSYLQKNPGNICLSATIVLKQGNKKEIMDLVEERKQKRLLTQPLEFPSAGSVFRNPDNDFAGRLIEDCGLKGYSIGGAMVSEKHANFIINYNKATAKDVHDLILYVKEEVFKKHKVELKIEQEFVNWE